MLSRIAILVAAVSIVAVGCSSEQSTAPNMDQMDEQMSQNEADGLSEFDTDLSAAKGWWGGHHSHDPVMFTVRIENVSDGMTLMLSNGETAPAPNSPGVWTVTRLFNPLFKIGHFDLGLGMEQQAEDGDPTMLAASMENRWGVKSSGVFNTPVGDDSPGPALPGKAYEFTIEARPGDHLSFSSMFGQSNDLFYSPGFIGIPLFRWGGAPLEGDVTRFVKLWDAGTEVNQEPGLGMDQAPRQSGPNTGESERMRVRQVRDEYTYPATEDVIRVTITPMSPAS